MGPLTITDVNIQGHREHREKEKIKRKKLKGTKGKR
jgi:hypothetical protein